MDPITRRDFARLAAGGTALVLGGCSGGAKTAKRPPRTAAAVAAVDPLRALARDLRGPLLLPSDAAYAQARLPFNSRYDGTHPRAVAQPLDTRDVQTLGKWPRPPATPRGPGRG